MLNNSKAFSSFSVDDIHVAKKFYGETLGLDVELQTEPMEMLTVKLSGGGKVLVYPKGEQHAPAEFTVLNFPVDNVEASVNQLNAKGIEFIQYDNDYIKTDAKGISRSNSEGDPIVAWFKDPAGNVLSVMQLNEQ